MTIITSKLGLNLQKLMREMLKVIEVGPEPLKQVAEPEKSSPESIEGIFK